MADSDNRVAIWVAVIALVGTLGAAVIANWPKLTSQSNLPVGQDSSAGQESPDKQDASKTSVKPENLSDKTSDKTSIVLAKGSFEFPGDGQKNNNQSIGDFCCTGETATVQTNMGAPLGYIYFYDFPGGGVLVGDGSRSAAEEFSVLVSGSRDPTRPDSPRVKS